MAINIDVNVDASKAERGVSSFTDKAKRSFTALGGVIAGVSVGAIAAFIKKTIDATDKIGKLSIRLGESTEFLSEMGFIAERSGVRIEAMQIGIQRANRRLAEFATTGKGVAMGAIKQLGLQVKNADGTIKSFEQILPEIADSLNNVSSSSEKVRLAFQLFDSEGVSFLQILNEGSAGIEKLRDQAKRFGATITQDMANKAAAAADSISNLTTALGGLGREAALTTAPGLTFVANSLTDILATFREKGLLAGFENLTEYMTVQGLTMKVVESAVDGVTKKEDKRLKAAALLAAEQEKQKQLAGQVLIAKNAMLTADAESLRIDKEIEEAKNRGSDLDREAASFSFEAVEAEEQRNAEFLRQLDMKVTASEFDRLEAENAQKIAEREQIITLEKEKQLAFQQQVTSAISPFANQFASAIVDARDLNKELKIMAKQLAKRVFAGIITGAVGQLFGVPFGAGFSAGSGFGSGFASGGSFTVPGSPSAFDTKNVQFKARPGETITVTPKGKSNQRQSIFNLNITATSIDRNFVDNELIPMLARAQRRFA